MIILASQSPRRKELLKLLGLEFEIHVSNIDETINTELSIQDMVMDLAYQKAKKVFNQFPDDVVIGSDTIVVNNNNILGKPKSRDDAFNMLKELSGKVHSVITAVSILTPKHDKIFYNETKVTFYKLSDKEIYKYIDTNEPMDKAGAYGIQGHAAKFVKSIEGDYYTVMGLPIGMLYQNLKDVGIIK